MSLYNMLFGMNPDANKLLSLLDAKQEDFGRFRNVYVEDGFIVVHTRCGGGNREDYFPEWVTDHPWYDHDAEAAVRFYAQTFPNSTVGAIHRAPSDFPGGKAGQVLTVEFTVCGLPCLGLNGGDAFRQSEAFSFQIATEDQAETDRYWNAIVGNGGAESACGWCKDQWGLSWQITPRVLMDAMARGGEVAQRAFSAMMTMRKIDVAAIEAAVRGAA